MNGRIIIQYLQTLQKNYKKEKYNINQQNADNNNNNNNNYKFNLIPCQAMWSQVIGA